MVGSLDELRKFDEEHEASITKDDVIRDVLRKCGLRDREIATEASQIPEEVRKHPGAATLMDPRVASRGFGIVGPTGVGKTMALAYLVKERVRWHVNQNWEKYPKKHYFLTAPWRIMWVNWPARAEWLRHHGFGEAYEDFMHNVCSVTTLVIDDIGGERIKGDASNEDFARHSLGQIIDARYRDDLNTWYTSNLNPKEMPSFYSDRAISRLLGDNPPITITGRDQRLKRSTNA